jgi:hypothetical protein
VLNYLFRHAIIYYGYSISKLIFLLEYSRVSGSGFLGSGFKQGKQRSACIAMFHALFEAARRKKSEMREA